MNTEKITSRQMILTMVIFRLALIVSYMPPIELPPHNQDIWVMVIVSIIYVGISSIPVLFLANRFRNITMVEYYEKILGKLFGKLILFSYGLYFIFNAVYGIILQDKIIGVEILPNTPYWLTALPMILLSIYAGSKGLETIFKIGDLISPIVIVTTTILVLLGLKNTDFTTLLPILSDSTFKEINTGAFMMAFVFIDIFILIMSVPFLENNKNVNKVYGKIVIFSKLLAIILIIVTQSAIGIQQTKHLNFPFLTYTRLIEYDAIIQRIDPLYIITWLYASVGRVVIYIYFSCTIFKGIFNTENGKLILYIVAISTGLIAVYSSDKGIKIMLGSPFANIRIYLSAIFIAIIPFMVTIVYFFRRKSLNQE